MSHGNHVNELLNTADELAKCLQAETDRLIAVGYTQVIELKQLNSQVTNAEHITEPSTVNRTRVLYDNVRVARNLTLEGLVNDLATTNTHHPAKWGSRFGSTHAVWRCQPAVLIGNKCMWRRTSPSGVLHYVLCLSFFGHGMNCMRLCYDGLNCQYRV